MLEHTHTVSKEVFDVWRSPGRFTKNPDLVLLDSGRLLLVYSDTDEHWSNENQILTILASDDKGATWFKLSEVYKADLTKGDERLVTPRLSKLSDGRLVVICDHDDYNHFHEDQPPGNWLWWSRDEGKTWEGPHKPCIKGFEPDRVTELPDGRLAVTSHLLRGDSQEFAVILTCSSDGGNTWQEVSTIAHDGYHRFCEGALVLLEGSALACVMRENHSAGIPCFVAFSEDMGRTWSDVQMLPFAFHRPYAKRLPDGNTLVTGRHVNGGLGTYAWCGNLRDEAGSYAIGGPRRKYAAQLTNEALVIENKPDFECRYSLLPPESNHSDVVFEAVVRVEGPSRHPVAFLSCGSLVSRKEGGLVLNFGSDFLRLGNSTRVDSFKPVDFSRYRTLTMTHKRGLLQVRVDGEVVMNDCIFRGENDITDFRGERLERRTQFGQFGTEGKSFWKRVSFDCKNPTLTDFSWSWEVESGHYPDQYQRERLLQLHPNHPHQEPWPDHGYSSWVQLPDERVLVVDYTNLGDPPGKSHLVGVYLTSENLNAVKAGADR